MIRWRATQDFKAVVHGREHSYKQGYGYNYDPDRIEHRDLGRKLFGDGDKAGWVKDGYAEIISGGSGGISGEVK